MQLRLQLCKFTEGKKLDLAQGLLKVHTASGAQQFRGYKSREQDEGLLKPGHRKSSTLFHP